jgi:hypothetical protein
MADSKTSRLEFQEFFNSGKIVPGFQAAWLYFDAGHI